jgi:hypothetical protein
MVNRAKAARLVEAGSGLTEHERRASGGDKQVSDAARPGDSLVRP